MNAKPKLRPAFALLMSQDHWAIRPKHRHTPTGKRDKPDNPFSTFLLQLRHSRYGHGPLDFHSPQHMCDDDLCAQMTKNVFK